MRKGYSRYTRIGTNHFKAFACVQLNAQCVCVCVCAGGAEERDTRLQVSVPRVFYAQSPPADAAGGSHCLHVPLPAGR